MKTPIEELGEEIEGLAPDGLTVTFHPSSSIWGTDWLKVSDDSKSMSIVLTGSGAFAIFLSPPEEDDQPEATIREPDNVVGWVEDHFNLQVA